VFHLVRSIPNSDKLDVLADPLRGPRRKSKHLPEFAPPFENTQLFPRPLLLPRTLGYSRGRFSLGGHLCTKNSHASNRPEVYSFPETSASSNTFTTTALLDFRLQFCNPTCPMIITSWVVTDWGGFLVGNPNNQVPTITTVTTILHMKTTTITPILTSFHPLSGQQFSTNRHSPRTRGGCDLGYCNHNRALTIVNSILGFHVKSSCLCLLSVLKSLSAFDNLDPLNSVVRD